MAAEEQRIVTFNVTTLDREPNGFDAEMGRYTEAGWQAVSISAVAGPQYLVAVLFHRVGSP